MRTFILALVLIGVSSAELTNNQIWMQWEKFKLDNSK